MNETSVRSERDGAVATVVLSRPARRNALTHALRAELHAALAAVAADPTVRCVVLTGDGAGFCAGQDLDELEPGADLGALLAAEFEPVVHALASLPVPTVAAVNGPAAGAGLGLALLCDLRLMAADAFLACAFAGIGLAPDTAVSALLAREIGHARAAELAFTGRRVPAAEALALGLVNRVVPGAELRAEAAELAARLAAGPTLALALTRRLLRSGVGSDLDAVLAAEREAQRLAGASRDFAEGVAAFRGRRPPVFEGR